MAQFVEHLVSLVDRLEACQSIGTAARDVLLHVERVYAAGNVVSHEQCHVKIDFYASI